MLVLALDTTTRAGSCAVARDGRVILVHETDQGRSHDAQLPAALIALLDDAGVTLHAVDVYAVATGPGSFTGLRVGIAAMQGLAFAAGKPLVGVSAFDALSTSARADAPGERYVATWIDAWRGDVYAALYEEGREIEPPTVERPDAILERHMTRGIACTFVGEAVATYGRLILGVMGDRARLAVPPAPPLAGTLASMATTAARTGHQPPPHAIRPLYVRRLDAELARDARPVR